VPFCPAQFNVTHCLHLYCSVWANKWWWWWWLFTVNVVTRRVYKAWMQYNWFLLVQATYIAHQHAQTYRRQRNLVTDCSNYGKKTKICATKRRLAPVNRDTITKINIKHYIHVWPYCTSSPEMKWSILTTPAQIGLWHNIQTQVQVISLKTVPMHQYSELLQTNEQLRFWIFWKRYEKFSNITHLQCTCKLWHRCTNLPHNIYKCYQMFIITD